MLKIESFPVGLLQCNCSIIACSETKQALIVDPGGDAPKILDYLKQHDLTARYLIHTHAHFDHVGATKAVHEATGAEILLHPDDLFLYDDVQMQGRMFGMSLEATRPIDRPLEDEMRLDFGQHQSLVLHTPGHTPGSVCFHLNDSESYLFTGDTLFQGSIGRTDLWGGSHETLIKSIRQRLLPLDDSTRVYPGHGPQTSIWQEKKRNPFLS